MRDDLARAVAVRHLAIGLYEQDGGRIPFEQTPMSVSEPYLDRADRLADHLARAGVRFIVNLTTQPQ